LNIARLSLATVLALAAPAACFAADILVPAGSVWRYLDNGSDPGTAWHTSGFDDSSWAAGPAQLGYGDGDEATIVSYGPAPSSKHITTYFRHSFAVASPAQYASLKLNLLRDDGAVVYLNGTEVARSNMPAGTITSTTLAPAALGVPDETTTVAFALDPAALVAGANLLAVEIHQQSPTSSDISFELELSAAPPGVSRGPYLQDGSSTGVTVRWRTDLPTDTRVRYGKTTATLTAVADGAAATTEHEVAITGLEPATRYHYSVGTTAETLAGGDGTHFFVTAPAPGTRQPARAWVLGDSGTANASAAAVRDAYEAHTGARHTDLWLMLGDNAYPNGTDGEYEAAVFDMYPEMLGKSVLWPTLGNHDDINAAVYFGAFTLPRLGEAGGTASGTEAYYSFDFANIHFVCLDSQGSDRTPGGAMLTWLQNDLASTLQDWIVAFWHHPPYSKGSHNSDAETQLIQMRQNALPILEAAGVDLVLTGHSHSYERSFLLDAHYGLSNTLSTPTMVLDGGDGRTDGDGAYAKAPAGPAAHQGAVYAVAGSSGQISGGTLNHPAMLVSLNVLGSMVLDFDRNQLDAKFITSTGAIQDHFTIVKDAAANPAVESITRLDASPTSAPQVRFRVSFTQSVTGVDMSDFTLALGGITGAVVTAVEGAGSTYIVTAGTGSGLGTIRLDLVDDDSIGNGIGTCLGGAGAGNGSYSAGQSYDFAVPVGISRFALD
jgi:hypothetical protein